MEPIEPIKPIEPKSTTQVLSQLAGGHAAAAEELLPLVYEDLRQLAEQHFRQERSDHTLQPTALIHEAYLKVIDQTRVEWKNRAHFMGVAATAMRRILINHAHHRRTTKRGGGLERVTLSGVITPSEERCVDLVALDDILTQLSRLDERQHRIVELRFFAGLTEEEIAEVMGISRTTVQTEWRMARAWLIGEFKKAESR